MDLGDFLGQLMGGLQDGPVYKLADDGKTPVLGEDRDEWEEWCKGTIDNPNPRELAITNVSKDVRVVTRFAGWNLQGCKGIPGHEECPDLFFETMIEGGKYNGSRNPYTTLDEAMVGHKEALDFAKKGITLFGRIGWTAATLWRLTSMYFKYILKTIRER